MMPRLRILLRSWGESAIGIPWVRATGLTATSCNSNKKRGFVSARARLHQRWEFTSTPAVCSADAGDLPLDELAIILVSSHENSTEPLPLAPQPGHDGTLISGAGGTITGQEKWDAPDDFLQYLIG